MACYAGEDKSVAGVPEWYPLDRGFFDDRVWCQLMRAVDVKAEQIGDEAYDWNLVGASPADGALAALDWASTEGTFFDPALIGRTPQQEARLLLSQIQGRLNAVLGLNYVEDCKRWRWKDWEALQEQLGSLGSTPVPTTERERWKAVVENIRAVIDAMTVQRSDAWPSVAVNVDWDFGIEALGGGGGMTYGYGVETAALEFVSGPGYYYYVDGHRVGDVDANGPAANPAQVGPGALAVLGRWQAHDNAWPVSGSPLTGDAVRPVLQPQGWGVTTRVVYRVRATLYRDVGSVPPLADDVELPWSFGLVPGLNGKTPGDASLSVESGVVTFPEDSTGAQVESGDVVATLDSFSEELEDGAPYVSDGGGGYVVNQFGQGTDEPVWSWQPDVSGPATITLCVDACGRGHYLEE